MVAAPPLARMALRFGPPEYFSLMILGLTILSYLSGGSMVKSLVMASFGILLGCVGVDTVSGMNLFAFGMPELMDGVGIVPIVMGLFGISEVLVNVEQSVKRKIFLEKVKNLFPKRKDWTDSLGPIFRGTFIGLWVRLLKIPYVFLFPLIIIFCLIGAYSLNDSSSISGS